MTKINFKIANTKLIYASLFIVLLATVSMPQTQTYAATNVQDDACKSKVSDTMSAKSSTVDDKKAMMMAEKDPVLTSKISGYKAKLGGHVCNLFHRL